MSLICWLPFNGNIENKGIGDVSITGNVTYAGSNLLHECRHTGLVELNKQILTMSGTICFWIYVSHNATISNNTILRQDDGKHRKWDLFLFPDKNSLHSWGCVKDTNNNPNGSFTYNNFIPNDIWTHITVSHDNRNQYIYRNGVLKHTVPWDSTGYFDFSGHSWIGGYGNGIYLNDFMLFDNCLGADEIKNISLGLLAKYSLDGNIGNLDYKDPLYLSLKCEEDMLIDNSGRNNNLYFSTKHPVINNDSIIKDHSSEFKKDSSQHLNREYFSQLSSQVTFNIWVKQLESSGRQFIMSQGRDYGTYGFNIVASNGIFELWAGDGNVNKILSSNYNGLNKWTMVTGVFDGKEILIYINGIIKNRITLNHINFDQSHRRFVIGKMAYEYSSTTSYFPFRGLLNNAEVYFRALNAEQIIYLFNKNVKIFNNSIIKASAYNETETTKIKDRDKIITKTLNEKIDIFDMKTLVLSDGSVWGNIFRHDCKKGTVLFKSKNECLNTSSEFKYSKLLYLDKYRDVDGKFEFMLRYPKDSVKYNRWKQTKKPQDEYFEHRESGTVVTGYEAIHIDSSSNFFGGLSRQNSDINNIWPTFIDGSTGHGNWFYAIGSGQSYNDGIPSSNDISANGSTSNLVELWIRLDNVKNKINNMCYTDLDHWKTGNYNWDSGLIESNLHRIILKKLLPVTPGNNYYFNTYSDDYNFVVREYDGNGNMISSFGGISNNSVKKMSTNTYFIGVGIYNVKNESVVTFDTYIQSFKNYDIKPYIANDNEKIKHPSRTLFDNTIKNLKIGSNYILSNEIIEE